MMVMKMFARGNVALLLLVLATTLDASRIFYLPLPKIHPSHPSLLPLRNEQHDTKSASNDRVLPSTANEHDKIIEREEVESDFGYEKSIDNGLTGKRTYSDNDVLPESLSGWDASDSLNRETRKPIPSSDTNSDAVNKFDENEDDNDLWVHDTHNARAERLLDGSDTQRKRRNDALFIIIVGTCSLVGIIGLVAAAIFWYKIQKRAEAAVDAEYPSYGVTGPSSGGIKISPSSTMSDRKLAQSAQMFHYQQQRQQMMAQEKNNLDAKPVNSDDSDDEAPNGGDYTVYECPGLAPTGEMEVRNPLFAEPDSSLNSSASALHPATNNHYPQPLASTNSSSPPKEKSLP